MHTQRSLFMYGMLSLVGGQIQAHDSAPLQQATGLCTILSASALPFRKLPLKNDQQAYEYCVKHQHSYIAIVWPIAQGKNKDIERILKQHGKILYYKKVYLDYKNAFHLLQRAHHNIGALREPQEMQKHVAWYFPEGTFEKPARIFVLAFDTLETAVACKLAVRGLYHLQYRSIHINDTHPETVELAKFFFRE
jgi:hypothetical protein